MMLRTAFPWGSSSSEVGKAMANRWRAFDPRSSRLVDSCPRKRGVAHMLIDRNRVLQAFCSRARRVLAGGVGGGAAAISARQCDCSEWLRAHAPRRRSRCASCAERRKFIPSALRERSRGWRVPVEAKIHDIKAGRTR